MSDKFLEDNYKVPAIDGNYMKFQDGENKFRIMTPAIKGWELWIDGKPKRYKEDEDVPMEDQENADIDEYTGQPRLARHFMAFVVWNRNAQPKPKVQILEITQKGIKMSINALNRSKDWGNPMGTNGYDIIVTRTKTGEKALNVEYSVMPNPKKKLDKSVVDLAKKSKINLEALFEGKDPFEVEISKEDLDKFDKDVGELLDGK
jgi:hypothetical protein